jgi:hypothetical protein
MNLDSWNTRCGYQTDNQGLLDELFTGDELSWTMDKESPCKGLSKIDVPNWADIDDGYRPVNAERIGNDDGDFFVVVTYSPNSTLGIGYKRVFIVEKSTQKPFPQTREMWIELRNRSIAKRTNKAITTTYANIPVYTGFPKGSRISDNITICDKGELRSAFGVPKTEEIYGIVLELCSIYNDWRKFPNETDYAVIETLKEAKNRIYIMQHHAKEFESEIDESRQLIKEQQERIADLEKRMNELYENGADAMNLLEEHGVKFNLNGEIQDDDEDVAVSGLTSVWLNQFNTIPYDPGAMITIDYSGSHYAKDASSNWGNKNV